ncbi:hypothetical protein [Arthrobacter sp. 35W]|uniref:hypothetical protein n=1 Tax=Arthrobacter sp. 35W TaxID=1132441 RepID=UPI0003FAA5AF|nr:hypothetical protein [Arthrobacter sp. 35W]
MTQTTTALPSQQSAYPDSIGFGFAELVALLNLVRGEAAVASARALRIENELEDPRLVSAGASSLVARGFAKVEPGGELSVAGPVAAVTNALTAATRRMEISLLTPEDTDNVLSVESPDYKVLLQPRAYLTWFAMAQNPDISAAEGNFYIIRKHLEDNPSGGATIRRREDASGQQLLLKRSGGVWTIGYNTPGTPSIEETSGLDDAAVLDLVRRIRQD